MREPDFWWRPPGLPARLLAPFGGVYGAIAAWRMRRAGETAGVPVVCVGNLTVGGAGKTPTALAIADLLLRAGAAPFFLTRGYGGRLGGPVRVEAAHSAADVGDEPLLLARVAPTIVARDRVKGAAAAVADGARIVIMDDGLQNPSLAKDVRIVVLDGRRGVGNGAVIPAGPLRAPLGTQLERADAVLVLGDPRDSAKAVINAAVARNVPVLQARLEPDASSLAVLRPQRMMAYAGIASPDKFFATLAAAGIEVAITRGFADHHPYTEADAAALIARATAERLALVTTEKDHVRLRGGPARLRLAELSAVLPVRVVFQDDAAIRRLLARVTDLILRAAPGAAASAPPRG